MASLSGDYIVLAMMDPAVEAQHHYVQPQNERIRRLLKILGNHNPLAISLRSEDRQCRFLGHWTIDMDSGFHHRFALGDIMALERLRGVAHGIYTDPASVRGVLAELESADLGISIVVSGLFREVEKICRDVGLTQHTVNMSLGIMGKTHALPEKEVLEFCTMCGHSLIAPNLVRKMIKEVKKGGITPEEASVELAKQCLCNLFNTERAVMIMDRIMGT